MNNKFTYSFYILSSILVLAGCTNTDINKKTDCSTSNLAVTLVSKVDVAGCKAITGSIVVNASGGKAPYDFSLNGGIYTTNNEFLNLGAGSYNVKAKDANNCEKFIQVEIVAANSTLDATTSVKENSKCDVPDGTITITGIGGKAPYVYLLSGGVFGSTNVFTNKKEGIYNVIVKDAEDCEKTVSVTVPRGLTGVSYATEIQNILTLTCNFASCHGSGTGSRDWTDINNVIRSANNIKNRTGNGSMPIGSGPTLSQSQIKLIACWVDDGAKNN